MEVDHTAQTIAEEQPDVAVRLVRAKLDFLLSEARAKPEPPPFPEAGTAEETTTWYFQHRRTKEFEELLERSEWDGLPAIAEIAPDRKSDVTGKSVSVRVALGGGRSIKQNK